MTARDELLEPRSDARCELARTSSTDPLLEHGDARALFLFAVMDQELAEHSNTCIECHVSGTRDEESFERVTEHGVLFDRLLLGSRRTLRMRIDELLFGERVADDFVGECLEDTALRCFFGLIEKVDDAAMLMTENFFES